MTTVRTRQVSYLFQLALELEEEGGFVSLEVGSTIIVLAGWDQGRFIYATSNVDCRMGTGYWRGRARVTRTDAQSKSRRFRSRALSSEGRYDFFEKFVVEIILGPAGNDLGLQLFPKLQSRERWSRRRSCQRKRTNLHDKSQRQ